MNFSLRNPVWIMALVVIAIVVVFAGSALLSGANAPVMAAQSGQGCTMMGGGGSGVCPMSKGGGMMGGGGGCAMLSGKVVSVGRDGALTVRIKPAANTPGAAKKAIGHLKAGDSVSMMMMIGKARSGASVGTARTAAKYACPMHPKATSGKPGK
jgi:hypothetical protein